MKKTLFTLLLMLLSAVAINAQSLTGKEWCTIMADEDGENIAMAMSFEKSGSCEIVLALQQEMKEDGVPITILAGLTIPGTYTLNDKDLKIDLNKEKAKAEIDYEIKGMDAKTKAMMDKVIKSELDGLKDEFKKEMFKGMPNMSNLKIATLESKRLVVTNSDNQEITFYSK